MSDLAFVCVSADLDLAEALADVFEAAGHTIGDRAENARAAIVIVSSDARRSGDFLEAARRATSAGKAIVVARLPLAAARIEGAPVFDLSEWDGDPDAPAIDALFSAVDLKLIAARFDDRGVGVARDEAKAPEAGFTPPRVHAKPDTWKPGSHWLGAARAIALIAILAGGALSAGLAIRHHGQEMARVTTAPAENLRVAFADSVLNDASFDNIAPPAPPPLGVRGREPPSAPSLRR